MKKIYFLILLVLAFQSCTFNLYEKDGRLLGILPLTNGQVLYRSQFDAPNISKDEIFRRARRWCILNYRSANAVLQLVDKETGEIVSKGYSSIVASQSGRLMPPTYNLRQVMILDVQPNYFVITITGLELSGASLKGVDIPVERFNLGSNNSAYAVFSAVDKEVKATMLSLSGFVKNPSL